MTRSSGSPRPSPIPQRSVFSDGGFVRVTYGAHDLRSDTAVGLSVTEIHLAYKDPLNIDADAEAYLNGLLVDDRDVPLRGGDRLEFMKGWGTRASEVRQVSLHPSLSQGAASVRLAYGSHDLQAEIGGLTVAETQLAFRDVLNVGPDAEAYLNGQLVEDKTVTLRAGDRLEFMKPHGRKASREDLQRIAAALEQIAASQQRMADYFAPPKPTARPTTPLFDLEEAAAYLGMSPQKLRRIIRRSRHRSEGHFVSKAIIQFQQDGAGSNILFRQSWLDDYLAASTVTPSDAPPKTAQPRRQRRKDEVKLVEGNHINFNYLD